MTVFEIIGMGAKKYGGFEKYIVEEARQLRTKGHKLCVIFDGNPIAEQYVADLKQLDVDIHVVPQHSKLRFIRDFWTLLRKYRPGVVHTNFSNNLYYAFPLAKIAGVKYRISSQHCLPSSETIKLRMAYQLSSILSTKIVAVSYVSARAQREAVWFLKSKISTLYLGVEEFRYDKSSVRADLGIKPETIAIMNIAYHNPVKGVDVLLEAMNIIVNKYHVNDIVLYQIGGGQTGTDTAALHSLAQKLGIDKYIVWMGIRNDVPRLLSAGDIYVQPSRSEGIGLSIMEASIAGLPTVASNVGGIPEAAIDGKNGIIVPPENPQCLADAIMTLYKDNAMRMAYGECGRKIALERFCLQNNVAKLISDYYNL